MSSITPIARFQNMSNLPGEQIKHSETDHFKGLVCFEADYVGMVDMTCTSTIP